MPSTVWAHSGGRVVGVHVSLAVGLAMVSAPAVAQSTIRVSVDSSGSEGNHGSGGYSIQPLAISADGTVIAFESLASNLVAGDTNGTNDVFVHDVTTGVTERVSVDSNGREGNRESYFPSISDDGRFVAFGSYASNLVPGDKNRQSDVFVRDRANDTTERVSVDSSGVEGNLDSGAGAISSDGRYVVFTSLASNLVANDTNGTDVFVHDRSIGITERVSVDSSGNQQDGVAINSPAISADGNVVVFASYADDLVQFDTNAALDVFTHDRSTGITERVSVSTQGVEGDLDSFTPTVSADGHIVVFSSAATTLVANDTNQAVDVFLHDRSAGTTELISLDSSGAQADSRSKYPSVRADGAFVVFTSSATNLVSGDTNHSDDIFLRDVVAGTTDRLSVDSSGAESDRDSDNAVMAGGGGQVAFVSRATNLVDHDDNGVWDVFIRDECLQYSTWFNYGAGFPGTHGVPSFTSQQNPSFGTTVTLDLANSYALPTVGALFVGFQRATIHSNWGGDLLVVPAVTFEFTFSYGGDSFTGSIPNDPSLCGLAVDLQAIEADPGAAKGVSFTQGLELVIGR
jgi:hypothetical protein